MSRIELSGKGEPIPTVALPDPNLDENLPAQLLLLEDGVPFLKADWTAFGYTNYEVWCVGGAGGQGGGVDQVGFLSNQTRPVMSAGDWSLYLEYMHLYNDPLGIVYSHWDPTPRPGAPHGMEVQITLEQYYEEQSPNHDPYYVDTWHDPYLVENSTAIGGGGGGGGVHVSAGLLADLPDSTPVAVGQAGINAGPGQIQLNGLWTPLPDYTELIWVPADTRLKVLDNYFNNYRNKYPLPHPSFGPPQPGGDGGSSSFGGTLCRASGGKGGRPAVAWSGANLMIDGAGGTGGVGGQTTAGGGGAGSTSGASGSDGTWDGTIGQGGGGGHGGTYSSTAVIWKNFTVPVLYSARGNIYSTNGGVGSFSYADTSVSGARQPKSSYPSTALAIVPGGGGGVRAMRKLNYGSRAPGFTPGGLVALRLTKIE